MAGSRQPVDLHCEPFGKLDWLSPVSHGEGCCGFCRWPDGRFAVVADRFSGQAVFFHAMVIQK